MKLLQNKLTREIGCLVCSFGKTPEKITVVECIDGKRGSKVWYYNSLAELNEEWCDVEEEPKDFWFIDPEILIACESTDPLLCDKKVAIETMKQIGNYFETKEDAEKAVEKLKAWKRLKDKGFKFGGHDDRDRGQLGDIVIYAEMPTFEYDDDSTRDDLDLLFCTEDN